LRSDDDSADDAGDDCCGDCDDSDTGNLLNGMINLARPVAGY